LNQDEVRGIPCPVPPIETQRSIGSKVRKAERLRELAEAALTSAQLALASFLGRPWIKPTPSVDDQRDRYHADFVRREGILWTLCAQAYRPEIAAVYQLISSFPNASLNDLCSSPIRTGIAPVHVDGGIPVIKTKNVESVFCSPDNSGYVSKEFADGANDCRAACGSVIMNITGAGSLGRAAVYLHNDRPVITPELCLIETQSDALDAGFLAFFLCSWWGQRLIEPGVTGSTGILHLSMNHIRSMPIPTPPMAIQVLIGDWVRNAHNHKYEAYELINAAKADVEDLIDGTLDQAKLLADGAAIDAWLAAHPRPEAT
jgi:type I restriction enzyme S subunit